MMRSLVILLWVCVSLAACSRGPNEVDSQAELQHRLENNFESGLFGIEWFRRNGSGPFRDSESGEPGMFIYYDAELVFLKDYNLTDWRGLNLGTLAYALGATELGIRGFTTRGNARGDILQVQGRLSFRQGEGDQWLAMEDGTHDESGDVPVDRNMTSMDPETALDEVRSMLGAARDPAHVASTAIVREFDTAVAQIDLRRASERGEITLGGGPVKGTYRAFSDAFGRFATAQGWPLHSFSSEGSIDNASRIQAGSLDFGLVQSDVAQLFYTGWGEKNVLPSSDLRAVASLWPEAVHLVTLADSGIESIADLNGRRLAIGVRGSGTRLNAIMIGYAAGLGADTIPEIREIGRDQAIRELENGDVDALFLTEAVPAPSLQQLARRRKDVRLVPIDTSVVDQLSERFFPYYAMEIKARSYPQQDTPYTTLGLAAVLMTSQHVADEAVERMLELLLQSSSELASQYYRAAFVTRDTMRLGVAVPLHPAAKRFYKTYDIETLEENIDHQHAVEVGGDAIAVPVSP